MKEYLLLAEMTISQRLDYFHQRTLKGELVAWQSPTMKQFVSALFSRRVTERELTVIVPHAMRAHRALIRTVDELYISRGVGCMQGTLVKDGYTYTFLGSAQDVEYNMTQWQGLGVQWIRLFGSTAL